LKHGQKISDELRAAQQKQFEIELKHGQEISDEFRAAQQKKDPGGAFGQFEKGFLPMWLEANKKPDTPTNKLEAYGAYKSEILTDAELQQKLALARAEKEPTRKQRAEAQIKLNKARRDITKRYKDLQGEAMVEFGGHYQKGSALNIRPDEADPLKGEDPTKSQLHKYRKRLDRLAQEREKEYAQAEEVYTSATGQQSETSGSNAPGVPIDTDVPARSRQSWPPQKPGGGSVGVEGGNDPLNFR
jgi:cell fate (sporulation/competence/biofilm development) regulator YmcA (YheA/YmcA/DUF963 family)